MTDAQTNGVFVYVGTQLKGQTPAIHVFALDTETGALQPVETADESGNATFLAVHPSQRYLYAASMGDAGDALHAFEIDQSSGRLTYLNGQQAGGLVSCHVSIDASGRVAAVANYTGGSVSVFPLHEDGSVAPRSQLIEHEGSSVHERQEAPHPHSSCPDPTNRFVVVPDLGLDKIMVYKLNADEAAFVLHDPAFATTAAGSGPRHFTFHPNGQFGYVISELNSTITAFAYDQNLGALRSFQTVSTLPEGFDGVNYCADIHIHPSGRFLYGSNRAHDSLVIFNIDEGDGSLTLVGHEPTRGSMPRSFAFSPDGEFVVVANRSGNVATFRVNQQSGRLAETGHLTEVTEPVAVKVIRLG